MHGYLTNICCHSSARSSKSDVKDVFWPLGLQSTSMPDGAAQDQAQLSSMDGNHPQPQRYRHSRDYNPQDDMRYEDGTDDWTHDYLHFEDKAGERFTHYGYGDHDFPQCSGSCDAGKCKLDQARPGCCYPDGFGKYAAEQQLPESVDATGSVNVANTDHHKQIGPGRDLVCWKNEDDMPVIISKRA